MHFELKPWSMAYLDDLVLAANNPKIAQFMTDTFAHPFTKESGVHFLKWATNNCPSKMLAIVVDGKIIDWHSSPGRYSTQKCRVGVLDS